MGTTHVIIYVLKRLQLSCLGILLWLCFCMVRFLTNKPGYWCDAKTDVPRSRETPCTFKLAPRTSRQPNPSSPSRLCLRALAVLSNMIAFQKRNHS